eukprot:2596765-Amphidinium_carterae.1
MCAWKKIVDHYESHQRTRFAGQLLGFLGWDFSLPGGTCLRHMEESGSRQHLLLNATKLNTWPEFKREVDALTKEKDVERARTVRQKYNKGKGKRGKDHRKR